MKQEEIERRIQEGRNSLKPLIEEETDYQSDQDLKKPQPPLVKEAMTSNIIALPTDFDHLTIDNDFLHVINTRQSHRVYTQQKMSLLELSYLLWLYVLYNNYIYNVYKDGKYRLEGGHRNDMNIKYRLLCKRLIEERKRVGVIQYYNVLFIMELLSDKDIWSLEQWMNGINNIYMKDIHNWCRIHFVKYHTVFVYRKEYPVKANIWNGYSYIRWRMERMMNLG